LPQACPKRAPSATPSAPSLPQSRTLVLCRVVCPHASTCVPLTKYVCIRACVSFTRTGRGDSDRAEGRHMPSHPQDSPTAPSVVTSPGASISLINPLRPCVVPWPKQACGLFAPQVQPQAKTQVEGGRAAHQCKTHEKASLSTR